MISNKNIKIISIFTVVMFSVLITVIIGMASAYAIDNGAESNIDVKGNQIAQQNFGQDLPKVSSPIPEGKYKIWSSASWCRILDIPGASKNMETRLNIYEHNGSNAQVFELSIDKDGYYVIKNINSKLVLDVKYAQAFDGANVWQYSDSGSVAQKWQIIEDKDHYVIKSALGAFFLDIEGANDRNGTFVNVFSSNLTDAQKWHFTKYDEEIKFCDTPIEKNSYVLSSLAAPSRALDVSGGSKINGANIQIYEGNRTNAQVFNFEHDSNGYYIIKNVNSDKVVDVCGAGTNNGTNVNQYGSNGTLAQKWVAIKNIYGSYTFHSALKKNLVMDLSAASDTNFANVQVYEYNGSDAQKWNLYNPTPAPGKAGDRLVDDAWYTIGLSSTEFVVDIPGASRNTDVCAQLYGKNQTFAQNFYFEWNDSGNNKGYYRIYVGCADGLCLGIKNTSILPYSQIITSNSTGDDTLWSLEKSSNSIAICNKANGMYFSISSGQGNIGSSVVSNFVIGAKPWTLSKVDVLDDKILNIAATSGGGTVIDVPGGSREKNVALQN